MKIAGASGSVNMNNKLGTLEQCTEECNQVKAIYAIFSSWIWQSSVLEVLMLTDLLTESITKRSANVRAITPSDGLSR